MGPASAGTAAAARPSTTAGTNVADQAVTRRRSGSGWRSNRASTSAHAKVLDGVPYSGGRGSGSPVRGVVIGAKRT